MSFKYRVEWFRGLADTRAWFVRVRADNDEIVLSSEAYTRKWSAKRAAHKIGKTFGLPVVEIDRWS